MEQAKVKAKAPTVLRVMVGTEEGLLRSYAVSIVDVEAFFERLEAAMTPPTGEAGSEIAVQSMELAGVLQSLAAEGRLVEIRVDLRSGAATPIRLSPQHVVFVDPSTDLQASAQAPLDL